ncbi:MAG: hypothetical protein COA42_08320 [Alteromonadaceae bacterium]|nr:MAG: hypothetical protein COA42_08320 [Alteromonadaceae bacterium]
MTISKILIVDDDLVNRKLLAKIFSEYDVYVACDGKQGTQMGKELRPDIIILDVVMGEMDGYEACSEFRKMEETRTTPIIFYSTMDSLKGRLKAYDLGGNDYISKSAPKQEMYAKVQAMLNCERERAAIKTAAKDTSSLLENLQRDSSDMHVVSKFVQACHFCHDKDTLAHAFLNCLKKLNTRGTLLLRENGSFFSSNGVIPKLEEAILRNSESFGRIYSFGAGRAVFSWQSIALLVKDVGHLIDTLAHLMDSTETALRAQSMHINLIAQIVRIEAENDELRRKLSSKAEKNKTGLKEQLFNSGLISRLDIQDEGDFEKIIAGYGDDLQSFFANMDHNASRVRQLLGESYSPPDELKGFFLPPNSTHISDDNVLF